MRIEIFNKNLRIRYCVVVALLVFIGIGCRSQYHQTDYGVKLDRLEVISYNRAFFRNLKAAFVWYNRTQRVVNASVELLQDLDMDIRVDIQMYKFLSNEYRFFPITLTEEVCQVLSKNVYGALDVITKSSNVKSCPLKKGFRYLRNGVIDFSQFPPHIPSGGYKLSAKAYHGKDFLLELAAYGIVDTFITKWEN